MTARYIVGDVFDVLATIPDNSVDLVMTSPPFLALRSYLPADHEHKSKEIGSEPTPGAFIDTLLDVVVECRRVLAPHGSLVFELGDTFAGTGGSAVDRPQDEDTAGMKFARIESDGRPPIRNMNGKRQGGGEAWPLDKSLCLIPQSFAWALSYGRNPFTGREIEPWRVRNVVAWCRPNPPVGALGDKFRPATSYLTVACTARDRYFDLDAVRTEPTAKPQRFLTPRGFGRGGSGKTPDDGRDLHDEPTQECHPAGAPPLDYWVIPTQPYRGSHYATFPTALVERPIESMCPRKVCRVCGQPSRRITGEPVYMQGDHPAPVLDMREGDRSHLPPDVRNWGKTTGGDTGRITRVAPTLGWSDCGHDDYRPGLVLDPFAGSGTTLQVALGHGRDAIGIDLDSRNAELAYERIGGLFLTIETT